MVFVTPPADAQRRRLPPAFAAAAAMLALSAAYAAQWGLGLHPCELCLAQRLPYALIVLIAAIWSARPGWRWLGGAVALLFFAEAGLAVYHVAVEQGWVAGPTACTAGGTPAASLDALKAQILAQQVVSCKDVAFRLLGLSMAGWNAAYALACSVMMAAMVTARPRNDGGNDVAAG